MGVGRRRSSGRRAAAYWAAAYWRRLSRFPSRAFCVVRKEREGAEREQRGSEKERKSERAAFMVFGVHFMTPPHDAFTRDTARLTSSNVYIHLGRDIHCPPPAFAPFACLVCWILLGWTSPVSDLRCACCVSQKKMSGKVEARKRGSDKDGTQETARPNRNQTNPMTPPPPSPPLPSITPPPFLRLFL